jgi:tetratricopeptide (TPR) repeat protein
MDSTKFFPKFILVSGCLAILSCTDDSKKNRIADLETKAYSLYEKDSYAKCRPFLDTLIQLDSTNGEYFYKRGVCFDRAHKYGKAQNDFLKSIALHYRPGEAYFTMGLEEMSGNDTTAIAYFQLALKANPDKKEEVEPLIKSCRLEIELENSEAAREFKDIKPSKQRHRPVRLKQKKHSRH